jgi:hypothetical protein
VFGVWDEGFRVEGSDEGFRVEGWGFKIIQNLGRRRLGGTGLGVGGLGPGDGELGAGVRSSGSSGEGGERDPVGSITFVPIWRERCSR